MSQNKRLSLVLIYSILVLISSYNLLPNNSHASEAKKETALMKSSWGGSIMFSTSELRKINKALKSFGLGGNSSFFKQGLETLENANATLPLEEIKAPKFYLSSIIYISETNWSIWINNKKVTPQQKHSELSINNISKKSVTTTWKTTNLNASSPNWTNELNQQKGLLHQNNAHTIKYNPDTKKLIFTLEPNQTIDIKTMHITEGSKPQEETKK